MRHVVWVLIVAAAAAAVADDRPTIPAGKTWGGKVVGVTDGDTLTLLVDQAQYKIRLAGIDAPESGQAFGTQAKGGLLRLAVDALQGDRQVGCQVGHIEQERTERRGRDFANGRKGSAPIGRRATKRQNLEIGIAIVAGRHANLGVHGVIVAVIARQS